MSVYRTHATAVISLGARYAPSKLDLRLWDPQSVYIHAIPIELVHGRGPHCRAIAPSSETPFPPPNPPPPFVTFLPVRQWDVRSAARAEGRAHVRDSSHGDRWRGLHPGEPASLLPRQSSSPISRLETSTAADRSLTHVRSLLKFTADKKNACMVRPRSLA